MTDLGRRQGGDQVIPRPAAFWVRPDNPWRLLDVSPLRSTQTVIERVHRFTTTLDQVPPPPNSRPSAVLVPIVEGIEGPEIVLTRRTKHLSSHKGEVSFPGGRLDGDESFVDAAIREAREEIGLDPNTVDVIGEMSAMATYVSRSYIVPVVAHVTERPALDVRNDEVDRVFTVPLAELVRQDTYSEEHWGLPPHQYRIHFFHLDKETVWGVTGRMLHQLINVALSN